MLRIVSTLLIGFTMVDQGLAFCYTCYEEQCNTSGASLTLGARPAKHIENGSYAIQHAAVGLIQLTGQSVCTVNTSAVKTHSANATGAEVLDHLSGLRLILLVSGRSICCNQFVFLLMFDLDCLHWKFSLQMSVQCFRNVSAESISTWPAVSL